jgi:hypothetical protein
MLATGTPQRRTRNKRASSWVSKVSVFAAIGLALLATSLCGEQAQAIHIRENAATDSAVDSPAADTATPADSAADSKAAGAAAPTDSAVDSKAADAAAPTDSAADLAGPAPPAADAAEGALSAENEAVEEARKVEHEAAEDAAHEKEAEHAADIATNEAANAAAGGITKESAASSCSPDKVGTESMRLCEASLAVLAGEPAYRAAVQTMESARDMTSEGETEEVLQNVLSQIDESLAVLASIEGAAPGGAEGDDQVVVDHAAEMESKSAEAVENALSLLDSALPLLVKVKHSRDAWRETVGVAADARKRFVATIDNVAGIKAEARVAKKLQLASVLNETLVVHTRLMDQLKTAKNMSMSAKGIMALDSATPEAIDSMMQFSRQATTAATATKKYQDKLEHHAAQLREELSLMEEEGGVKSSAPAPAASEPTVEKQKEKPAFEDPELMLLKTKSEDAMKELALLAGTPAVKTGKKTAGEEVHEAAAPAVAPLSED